MKNILLTLFIGNACFVFSQFGPGGVGNISNNGLWLRADQIEGLNDGDNMPIWEDQSGNGNDAANATVGEQPQFYSTSTLNNRPVARFDGGDQMIVPDANILDGTPGLTYFSVIRRIGSGGAKGIVGKRITYTTPVDYAYSFFFWNSNRLYLDTHTNNDRFNTTTGFPGGNNYMPAFVYDGSLAAAQRSKIYNAGNLEATGYEATTSLPNSAEDLCIGALNVGYGQYLNGDLAEIIHYNFAVNTAQRIIVENYLGAKYNMAITNDYFSYNLTHGNEVAGIGREDAANLHDDSQGSSFVRVNTPSAMGNGDYLIWGHDDGDITNNNTVDVDGVIIQSRLNRVWRVEETGDVGTVRMVFDISSFSTYNLSDVRLLIDRDGDGFFDNDVAPASGNAIGAGVIEFTGVDFQNGDFFTLGSINESMTPLPVELLSFDVKNQKESILSFWSTATEKYVSHFEVLRSIDAQNWTKIGTVEAAGNSNQTQNYQFKDLNPLDEVSYYRLKTTDNDGSYSLSLIKSVNRESLNDRNFVIYPNPASGKVHLSSAISMEDVNISFLDPTGRKIRVNTLYLKDEEMVIDISNLSEGVYLVVFETKYSRTVKKLQVSN